MVKLAPGDEHSPVRTFYLRLSSEEEAQDWAQAIRETRFDYVRGERDALRSAKTGLTYQVRPRPCHPVAFFCGICRSRAGRP